MEERRVKKNRAKIFISGIIFFVILWTLYFLIFKDWRFAMGYAEDDPRVFIVFLPLWLSSAIKYGFWIPILVSFIYSFMAGWKEWRDPIKPLILSATLFSVYAISLELIYEHRPVAMWKMHLVTFPFLIFVGGVLGWFGKRIISNISYKKD